MNKLERFVSDFLKSEITEIENTYRIYNCPELSVFEKALIYHYTDNVYDSINSSLRNNKRKHVLEIGKFLENTLKKLPNYTDLVFSSANLSLKQIQFYNIAFQTNSEIIEYCFVSTSKKQTIAKMYLGNVFFEIFSKSAKDVEPIAKFGVGNGQNEYEVIFCPNSKFNVLNVTKMEFFTLIVLMEV